MSYQDISDNADYLLELSAPKNPKSYERNQIYVIQQSIPDMPEKDYKKIIVKSILPNELVIIPVLAKGSTYAKRGNVPRNIKLNTIQYAYKLVDSGYLEFSKIADKMQNDGPLKIKSTTSSYQKVLQTKELPDQIKSFLKPPNINEIPKLETNEEEDEEEEYRNYMLNR